VKEEALVFGCGGDSLVGVLVVVGGPQYRAGSHRQFTLLARDLAANGIASLRFDYRGMGDSSGEARTFESIKEDIACAIDRLLEGVPAVNEVVIWGLCDAASAALFYAHRDARVSGVVLANPWVRTDQGMAQAYLRHYYGARLMDRGFWKKLLRAEIDFKRSVAALGRFLIDAARPKREAGSLPERMQDALRRFSGRVLLILSGKDLTADEFRGVVGRSKLWKALLADARVTQRELPEANHTFSRREWRDRVARWTAEWVKQG
jgi:exosortase A-associated hydrolase 1